MVKSSCENEYDTRIAARKSIVITKDLPAGHILTAEDLDIKRPGDGIPPKYLDSIPGSVLLKTVTQDTTLHLRISRNEKILLQAETDSK